MCSSTNGIFDPIKASLIEIEVWVKAPAFISIPSILLTEDWILSTISPSWLLWKHSSLIFFSLALPGGLIVLLASGFLFGTFQGFIINIITISLGSLIFIYFRMITNVSFTQTYVIY